MGLLSEKIFRDNVVQFLLEFVAMEVHADAAYQGADLFAEDCALDGAVFVFEVFAGFCDLPAVEVARNLGESYCRVHG